MTDTTTRIFERAHGRNGLIAIGGAGFYFGWFDALFMGSLSPWRASNAAAEPGAFPELGALLIFAISALVALAALRSSAWVRQLTASRLAMGLSAAAGSLGSLLIVASDSLTSLPLLWLGAFLGGWFMAVFQFGWCAAFCQKGARTATPLITGAFALATVLDLAPLLMTPVATAIVFSLFPLASCAAYRFLDAPFRSFAPPSGAPERSLRATSSEWKFTLGMSPTLLVAFSLMFVCFGTLQHLISFAPGAGSTTAIAVQIVRGGAALLLFFALVVAHWRASAVYRTGLVVLIAGCLGSSLLSGEGALIMNGVIMVGFMAFNVLIYVAFSQVAHAESNDPCKTMGAMWLITSGGVALGGFLALMLERTGISMLLQPSQAHLVLGYFIAIASVLLLSSEDIWIVLGIERKPRSSTGKPDRSLGNVLAREGLTARECEVALLLEQGRTQTWIAASLTISESTVATHVRHIYQKLGVHNRQEFLDYCRSEALSSKTDEHPPALD